MLRLQHRSRSWSASTSLRWLRRPFTAAAMPSCGMRLKCEWSSCIFNESAHICTLYITRDLSSQTALYLVLPFMLVHKWCKVHCCCEIQQALTYHLTLLWSAGLEMRAVLRPHKLLSSWRRLPGG